MWKILIANDPDDDYNLTIELWYGDEHCGTIKWEPSQEKYMLFLYPNKNNFIITCDILKDILAELDTLEDTRKI